MTQPHSGGAGAATLVATAEQDGEGDASATVTIPVTTTATTTSTTAATAAAAATATTTTRQTTTAAAAAVTSPTTTPQAARGLPRGSPAGSHRTVASPPHRASPPAATAEGAPTVHDRVRAAMAAARSPSRQSPVAGRPADGDALRHDAVVDAAVAASSTRTPRRGAAVAARAATVHDRVRAALEAATASPPSARTTPRRTTGAAAHRRSRDGAAASVAAAGSVDSSDGHGDRGDSDSEGRLWERVRADMMSRRRAHAPARRMPARAPAVHSAAGVAATSAAAGVATSVDGSAARRGAAVSAADDVVAQGASGATHGARRLEAAEPPVLASTAGRMGRRRGAAAAAAAADGSSSEESSDETTSSDEDSDDSQDDRYSTECTECNVHIARADPGGSCDVWGCRATKCARCMPDPVAYLCRQHSGALVGRPAAAAGAGQAATGPAAAPSGAAAARVAMVRALPEVVRKAARSGVEAALVSVERWSDDPDFTDLVDDLVDTLNFGAVTTKAKNNSAIRRLEEFLSIAPTPLLSAVATPGVVDVLLSSYVSARLRLGRRRTQLPPQWTTEGSSIPEPPSVKGEVGALVGLLRLAAVLPPDPRGTLPLTRRVMRKSGCYSKHASSPRAYTFAWELTLAWRRQLVPRDNPVAFAAFALFLTAIHFLLRPIYARSVEPGMMTPDASVRHAWRLDWERGDKSRQPALTAAVVAAQRKYQAEAEAASAAASGAGPSDAAGAGHRPRPAGRREAAFFAGLPSQHPRVTGTQGRLFDATLRTWMAFRGAGRGPLFCRVEVARQTKKVPAGAKLRQWTTPAGRSVPCFVWEDKKMSERILKRWLVTFLTPVIGAKRAHQRVLSGLRGGGAMELEALGAPLPVRATVGWWVARRLSAEGALITYVGCSMEDMWKWTRRLGERCIRVLAPGVFKYVVSAMPGRAARARVKTRKQIAALCDDGVAVAAAPGTATAARLHGATS